MLLLKKKKYAAVKVQFKDGTPYEVCLSYYFASSNILEEHACRINIWCRLLNAKVLILSAVTGAC